MSQLSTLKPVTGLMSPGERILCSSKATPARRKFRRFSQLTATVAGYEIMTARIRGLGLGSCLGFGRIL